MDIILWQQDKILVMGIVLHYLIGVAESQNEQAACQRNHICDDHGLWCSYNVQL